MRIAMTACPECKREVSDLASACPNCGCPIAGHSAVMRQELNEAVMRMLLPVGRSFWAIAAGYLGLFSLLIIPAPLALICGIMAVREIRRNPDKHGMGRAVFGIMMGGIGTAFILFILILLGIELVNLQIRARLRAEPWSPAAGEPEAFHNRIAAGTGAAACSGSRELTCTNAPKSREA
jgi:hypothetical protein